MLILLTCVLVQATPAHLYKNFPPSRKVKALAVKTETKEPTEKPEQPAPQAQAPAVVATQTEAPAEATTAPVVQPQCVTGFTVADYYENLVMQRESGGNSCITNYLGCVGLFQACPGSKLYAACPTLDVNCQLTFFTNYMLASYGSWANAWNSEVTRGWW